MSTALNISGFRFQVTGEKDGRYDIQIDRSYPWEMVTAYGTLVLSGDNWILDGMTFENAHQEVMLQDFFRELLKVRVQAYPELIKYYQQNQPVNGVNSIMSHFKQAI